MLRVRLSAALLLSALSCPLWAQEFEDQITWHRVPVLVDSGLVENRSADPAVLFAADVVAPGAPWLRVELAELVLAGDPAADNHSYLRITSKLDGAVQILSSETAEHWRYVSAAFNGEAVRVELIAWPGTGPNRVRIDSALAGDPPRPDPRTLCGVDDRVLSSDPRSARLASGCTVWLFNDLNHQFLSAGHCDTPGAGFVEFNVPLSNPDGSINRARPEDQYPIDVASIQRLSGGVGNDWNYFGCLPNSNTGLTAYQVQRAFYVLAPAAPPVQGQIIRITGYGTVTSPVPREWNQVQKTHSGPYYSMAGTTVRYAVDTTGGNSGSCVFNETDGLAIGIHTHGGCPPANYGTAIHNAGLQAALAAPRSVCASGGAPVSPPLFVAGDLNNNFGTVHAASGAFGRIAQPLGITQGLAYSPHARRFYATTGTRVLYTLHPVSGLAVRIGDIGGTQSTMNGLAYDPGARVLYGISQSDGQLFRIDPATAQATPIGSPGGGNVGALDYDSDAGVLYGIDDAPGGSRLVRIDTASGVHSVIGPLGAGINDCNGLAYNPSDQRLYTIEAATENLYRIDPNSGLATLVGPTGGVFGAAFGMAAARVCAGDLNDDGQVDQTDLGILLAAYGSGDGGDLDGDGDTDQADLGILLAHWLRTCPS